jgi:hypothetical protein
VTHSSMRCVDHSSALYHIATRNVKVVQISCILMDCMDSTRQGGEWTERKAVLQVFAIFADPVPWKQSVSTPSLF